MVFDLLRQEHILIVHATAFSWSEPDHFRLVFLPHPEDLSAAMKGIARFFKKYYQEKS